MKVNVYIIKAIVAANLLRQSVGAQTMCFKLETKWDLCLKGRDRVASRIRGIGFMWEFFLFQAM